MKLQLSMKKDGKITSVLTDSFEKVDNLVKEYTELGYAYQGVEVRPNGKN